MMVRAAALRLGYGHRAIVEDAEFVLGRGEFWFFIGPNGCGKTTLLKAVLGLLRPLSGRIELAAELTDRSLVGFVPQRFDQKGALPTTVREFVLLGTVGTRLQRSDRAERLSWALSRVGIERLADLDLWSLSGGQRQRAVLARALIRRPHLLILDEPTTGLDLAGSDSLLRFLEELHADGLTIIAVSHDLATAARYATHVGLFDHGHVLSGRREDIINSENLGRVYGVRMEIAASEGHDRITISVHPDRNQP
jgi:ABC-type Mn2+/Zn2+ transport system ATPase subunit